MRFDLEDVIGSQLFVKTVKQFLGSEEYEVVTRPACYFFKQVHEGERLTKRALLLPPHGFVGDRKELLNPHTEARTVKVKILGKIRPLKKGFRPLIHEVEFRYSSTRYIPTESASSYARYSEHVCGSQMKSWRNWFFVVKKNGWGNFHTLINHSDEWALALVEKILVDQKPIRIESYLQRLPAKSALRLQSYLNEIVNKGDEVFRDNKITTVISRFPLNIAVPVLVSMLNVMENGRHQPCTFFALLLKLAKQHKEYVLHEVEKAMKLKTAPYYYLQDLYKKLNG